MSRKRKSKPEVVQTTLDELIDSKPKKKKATAKKKAPAKKKAKPTADAKPKTSKKKKTPKTAKKKAPAKKKAKPTSEAKPKTTKKKTSSKKKETPKTAKKKAPAKPKKVVPKAAKEPIEPGIPLGELPGIGAKLEERLTKAGYVSVEKISRARAASIAKKVDGISASRAKSLIASAKQLIRMKEKGAREEVEEEETGEAPPKQSALTDLPGIGKKLALKIESAGYDSIARLSRARSHSLSRAIGGLSASKAEELVVAAREFIQRRQLESISETVTVVSTAKEAPAKKTKGKPKKKAKKPTPKPEKPPKEETPTPAAEPTVSEETAPPKPKRKRRKAIKKKSGLPVPEAVTRVGKEMRRKWRQAEKRAAAGETTPAIAETVEVVALTGDETRDKILEMALEILNETMITGRPAFEIPSRSADNIVWDEFRDLLLLGMRTITRPYHSLGSVVDATRTARVMEIVYQLLESNLHATKREVFYSDVNLFRDQKYSDKIIEDVASMLRTTRDSIHVVASARGSAMGRVVIEDGGDRIDLTRMGTGGWAITPFLDQVEILESDAEYILLSEKDAAVMRLAEAKFWNRQPCIILTGKGSGDIATRAFLKKLVKELEIPAFALVDSDPYGHYIYSVFLRGSKRLSYESPFIATPELKLLGVLSRDLDEHNIPKAVRIPMVPTDIKRVKDMLKEPFVQKNKEWVEDLKLMLKMKEKAEIQSFASHSFKYLTDEYLPTKLETGDWI